MPSNPVAAPQSRPRRPMIDPTTKYRMPFSDGTIETDTEYADRQHKLGQKAILGAAGRGISDAVAVVWIGSFVLMVLLLVVFLAQGPPV